MESAKAPLCAVAFSAASLRVPKHAPGAVGLK